MEILNLLSRREDGRGATPVWGAFEDGVTGCPVTTANGDHTETP